ncbi:heme lyase CcmF/NrfE family subunit [Caldichromatium japonicum]|uniref:Heme lyase CcmF/NrfE family subunit n=1 Tax=Caldichromatium japonicum TaxID=2699430 RepID=A0A6G7VF20_9GAMM|nr:heme lyase CcmF/NrfE family subunit [Caldichromatium japonicum]QIK38466.1 heme lyase CcmF/NrfE family subunit [Caldichromatium japonicum]
MIPELGHFALWLALLLALTQAGVPLIGSLTGNRPWMLLGRPLAWGQLTLIGIAFLCLLLSFLRDDFSVIYVATNSNTLLPTPYKISAIWGGHEGSLLLWILMLAGWGSAVAHFSRHLPLPMVARVIAVQGMVTVGFLAFILLTSNPFARIFPSPPEGRDLNPLLQDPGLAIHPPMLYMGYVGFSVAFAFAIAALISGRLDAAWARWSRPWTTVAWVFLTIGIALGSWWAYYELGWGGWWFWDPVENASFMPWLVGTALIHSLAVTEKRAAFKNWTVLLAVSAFSFSLLGTFLVRSGVLTSVHAFASDPARGVFILVFLCIVIGSSLALYAWQAPRIASGGRFDLVSRETFLLINNLLMTILAALVLFGTLAPLIYEALGLGRISVGFPWFNRMFVALSPVLVLATAIGPHVHWKHDDPWRLIRALWVALIFGVAALLWTLTPGLSADRLAFGFGIGMAVWLVSAHLLNLLARLKHRGGLKGLGADLGRSRSYYGMWLAHIGLAVFIVGATIVSICGSETDVRLSPGASHEVVGYRFTFNGVTETQGPNYRAFRGDFTIHRGERQIARLYPEKRHYVSGGMPMTEAAIDAGLTRDIYVSLGEPVGDRGDWAVRLYYKPYVRWIWLGCLLMAAGGLLAASDRRYRLAHQGAAVPSGIALAKT